MEYFICDSNSSGANTEIYLNDIPVTRLVPGISEREAMPVNQFLISGTNQLRILVKTGAEPASALGPTRIEKPSVPVRAFSSVTAYPKGAIPGEDPGREIARLEQEISIDREMRFPHFVETSFDSPHPFPKWAWQTAPKLTLNDRLRVEVLSLLRQIATTLERADGTLFLDLARIRFDENGIAYGIDAGAARQRWSAGLQQLSSKPNWTFEPPSLEMMSLRLCADSRLIECSAVDWRPIVRARRNEHGVHLVHYPMFLAKMGGQLQIVR